MTALVTPGREERDERDPEHHLDAADDFPGGTGRDDVSVADGRHGLERPPDGLAEGREALLVEEADCDRSREGKPYERRRQGKRDRARIGDLPDPPLDERGAFGAVFGRALGHPGHNSTVRPRPLAGGRRFSRFEKGPLGRAFPSIGAICATVDLTVAAVLLSRPPLSTQAGFRRVRQRRFLGGANAPQPRED